MCPWLAVALNLGNPMHMTNATAQIEGESTNTLHRQAVILCWLQTILRQFLTAHPNLNKRPEPAWVFTVLPGLWDSELIENACLHGWESYTYLVKQTKV